MATLPELDTLISHLGLEDPVPRLAQGAVLGNPIDVFRRYLAVLLGTILSVDTSAVWDAFALTTDISLGDLAVIIPRLKSGTEKLDTEKVQHAFSKTKPKSPLFSHFLIDGVQIRCFFHLQNLPRFLLPFIESRGVSYGRNTLLGLRDPSAAAPVPKKAVIEFSSPNIPGEFNDAHLRSTILGSFIANIYECMGWDVVRLNYLGDWGKQIGLLAVGWQRYGDESLLKKDAIGHLLEVNARIEEGFKLEVQRRDAARNAKADTAAIETRGIFAERDAFFNKMEAGDAEALALWKRFRDIFIADTEAAYRRMGVNFTEYSGESQVKTETMAEVEETLKKEGILEESDDGSWVIDFTKHAGMKRGMGTVTLRGRTGTSTYLLRDVAATIERERTFGFDDMVYVVSSRQMVHFSHLFGTLELMGLSGLRQKLQHASFGRTLGFTESLGGAHTLGAILDRTAQLMRGEREAQMAASEEADTADTEVADIDDTVAVSSVIEQDTLFKRSAESAYDIKRMTSDGQKLQQCRTVLKQAIGDLKSDIAADAGAELDDSVLRKTRPAELLRTMAQYPDVTAMAYKTLEPSTVQAYLHRLAEAVAYCNENPKSEDGDEDDDDSEDDADGENDGEGANGDKDGANGESVSIGQKKAWLALYRGARQVLENGMRLLNIPVVD